MENCSSGLVIMAISTRFYISFYRYTCFLEHFILSHPIFGRIPEPLRLALLFFLKLIISLLFSKLVFSLGYLFMGDDLTRAYSQFLTSSSGGMSGGSFNPPGSSGNYVVLGASIADNDPNPPGSPSWSEEFPCVRMSTPDIAEMESAINSVFDSVPEPLLSEEQRRDELSLKFKVQNGIEPTYDEKFIDAQMQLEVKLESALRAGGYSEKSILECRHEWRQHAFSPDTRGKYISKKVIKI